MESKKGVTLLLLFTTSCCYARILRLSCYSHGEFNVIKENAVLQGSLLMTLFHMEVEQCLQRCIFEKDCKSVNTNPDGTCELNSQSAEDLTDCVKLTSKTGWTSRSTNYSATLIGRNCQRLNPCGKGVCLDSCECPGYQCLPCQDLPGCQDDTQFFIKHSGGRCISKQKSTDHLIFTSTCCEKFTYTSDQTLKHIQSGKCIRPATPNRKNQIIMLTSNCGDDNATFIHTGGFSLQQKTTSMCIHPKNGYARPPSGNTMVLHPGCDQSRLRFDFI